MENRGILDLYYFYIHSSLYCITSMYDLSISLLYLSMIMHIHPHFQVLLPFSIIVDFMNCLNFMCFMIIFVYRTVIIYIIITGILHVDNLYILTIIYLFDFYILPSNSSILLLIIYYTVSIKMIVLSIDNPHMRPICIIISQVPKQYVAFHYTEFVSVLVPKIFLLQQIAQYAASLLGICLAKSFVQSFD